MNSTKNKKPVLAVDLDGVCADFMGKVLEMWPQFKDEYNSGHLSNYFREVIDEVASDRFVYRDLKPIQDSRQFLVDIAEFYQIIYITGRPLSSEEITVAWLKDNGFPEPDSVIFTREKGLTCISIEADTLIEDQIRYAIQAASMGVRVVLLDYPYNRPGSSEYDNRAIQLGNKIERAVCWVDVMFKTYFTRRDYKTTTVEVQATFAEE